MDRTTRLVGSIKRASARHGLNPSVMQMTLHYMQYERNHSVEFPEGECVFDWYFENPETLTVALEEGVPYGKASRKVILPFDREAYDTFFVAAPKEMLEIELLNDESEKPEWLLLWFSDETLKPLWQVHKDLFIKRFPERKGE